MDIKCKHRKIARQVEKNTDESYFKERLFSICVNRAVLDINKTKEAFIIIGNSMVCLDCRYREK